MTRKRGIWSRSCSAFSRKRRRAAWLDGIRKPYEATIKALRIRMGRNPTEGAEGYWEDGISKKHPQKVGI